MSEHRARVSQQAEGIGAAGRARASAAPDRVPIGQSPTVGIPALSGRSGERAALALQRLAGNHAVAASLAQIEQAAGDGGGVDGGGVEGGGLAVIGTPISQPAAPPDGAEQIREAVGGGSRAAGYTSLPAPGSPELAVAAPTQQDGQWRAAVQPTSVTPDAATSLYPAPGIHRMSAGPVGQTRHRDVTPEASDEIKRGEEEHLLDLEWARHLSYDSVADTINAAAAGPPATGPSADAARQAATDQVRSALPAQLRWPPDGDPVRHWRRVYGALVGATRERDTGPPQAEQGGQQPAQRGGWHNMSSAIIIDPAEKTRLGLPEQDELYRYLAGTTQVGQHPPEPHVRARYDALPGLPVGEQPPASSETPAGPAPAEAPSQPAAEAPAGAPPTDTSEAPT